MFSSMTVNNASLDYDIKDLPRLVKENKLDEIKTVIRQAKANKRWDPYFEPVRAVHIAMRDAILSGKLEIADLFLQQGLRVNGVVNPEDNTCDSYSFTTFAVKSGNFAMVELFINNGADIKPINSYYRNGDNNPITEAVLSGRVDLVNLLLDHGAEVDGICDKNFPTDSLTFLAKAALDDNIPLIETLINHGASIEKAIESALSKFQKAYERYGFSIYWHSNNEKKIQALIEKRNELQCSYARIVKTLLDYGQGEDFSLETRNEFSYRTFGGLIFLDGLDRSKRNPMDISGFNLMISINGVKITPDMIASLKGAKNAIVTIFDLENLQDIERKAILKKRLEAKFQKCGRLIDDNGIVNLIPLWLAAEGDTAAVKARLEAGVDPNESNKEKIPIVIATRNGQFEIVKMLVEATQKTNKKIDKKALETALDIAEAKRSEKIVNYLSEQMDVNEMGKTGEAFLHRAVKKHDIDKIKNLINRGANVNQKNLYGKTPLFIASGLHNEKSAAIIDILLQNNADANQHPYPLQEAVKKGNSKAVALLLPYIDKQDVVSLYDKEKKEPWYVQAVFDALKTRNAITILSLLKNYGADFNIKDREGQTPLHLAIDALPTFVNTPYTFYDMEENVEYEDRDAYKINRTKKYQEDLDESVQLIRFLIDNGADINLAQDKKMLDKFLAMEVMLKQPNILSMQALLRERQSLYDVHSNAAFEQKGDSSMHETIDSKDTYCVIS